MSKYFNSPVVGIDVSADFSVVAILSPTGDIYKKPFKIYHSIDGFNHLIKEIKKVEEEYNMKTGIFMESTGVYHLSLFHYLKNNSLEVYVINPLITNSNKNNDIRKVKNDKKDSLSIARIGKYENIKASDYFDVAVFTLKSLCRDYYKITDTRSLYKKKLSSDLYTIFLGYSKVFSDITGATSIAILKEFQSPKAILAASKDRVIEIFRTTSRKSLTWCNEVYDKLINAASSSIVIGIPSDRFSVKIITNITIIEALDTQLISLLKEIKEAVKSIDISDNFRKNVMLLESIPGIGFLTSVTILAEIGDINGFVKPKHLVAYFGIDPSVNESGKFKSDKNKMSKRGTRIGRRALYAAALASIRTKRNGEAINEILLNYYKENLNGKKKKVALVAVMHKLINYIFAVLRNQKEYEQRLPKIHNQMYLKNTNTAA